MANIDVFVPSTLEEAVAFLAHHGDRAVPIAGGTDVMIDTRIGRISPEWLVDLRALSGLSGIEYDANGFRIGALTRIRSIELDQGLRQRSTALVEAARVLGSVQVRTMATIGGNLCHATPSAEMPPALLVHHGIAEIAGPDGIRSIPLGQLFVGPGHTSLEPGEILVRVTCKAANPSSASSAGSCYLRQTVRWAMDLAGVGVAASIEVDEAKVVSGAKLALSAVAPVPLEVDVVSDMLVGKELTPQLTKEVGRVAAEACSPISDVRGTAEYRRQVVAALVPRALYIAWLRATQNWPVGKLAPINGVLSEEE